MTKKYRKEKNQREMQEKGEELGLVRDPNDITFATKIETEPEPEVPEVKETEEKMYYDPYYGGAMSFADMDSYHAALEKASDIQDLTYAFRGLVDNILSNAEILEKDVAITALATEFQQRMQLRKETSEKGVIGKFIEKVKEKFKKPEPLPAFKLLKDADGNDRWLGYFTNNYKDKEGEIASDAAHKEYAEYLDANPDKAPLFRSWHTPGTDRESRIDFWDYDKGFFVVGGKLTSEEAAGLEKALAFTEIGLSHGFYGVKDGNVIKRYRTFEISDLPLAKAANGWTGLDLIQKEALSMNKDKREYLVEVHGEDVVAGVEAALDAQKAMLDEFQVESKEIDEVKEDVEEKETPAPDASELVTAIVESLGLKELSETIETLSKDVGELKVSTEELKVSTAEANKELDEKVAEELAPKSNLFWMKERPSQSDETLLDEEKDKELMNSKPKHDWISENVS